MTLTKVPHLVLVIGYSGAGRNTVACIFEDLGYDRVENLPPVMIADYLRLRGDKARVVMGFGDLPEDMERDLLDVLETLRMHPLTRIIFLKAEKNTLIQRYSITRRRHPYRNAGTLEDGIDAEIRALAPFEFLAHDVIDTTKLSPHDLKFEIIKRFGLSGAIAVGVEVISFSYKNGLPPQADMVFDCRFLRNPHWNKKLRERDGRDKEVEAYIREDPNTLRYQVDIQSMLSYMLNAISSEGRSYFTIAFGCSGGQHRSVMMAEWAAKQVIATGRKVTLRHTMLKT